MGKYDSSKTRVQPIFRQLLERDPFGTEWLSELIACAPRARELTQALPPDPGLIVFDRPSPFEYAAPPSQAFLRWLISNPHEMRWPTRAGVELTYSPPTQRRRECLLGRHGQRAQKESQQEALSELDRLGPEGSARRWWAFEGFTKVDFCLSTPSLLLFVEGKRTEKVAASNDWFQTRSQLVRNLEVVGELAAARAAGVILGVEEPTEDLHPDVISASTPHLSPAERDDLERRYLGQVRWRELCTATGIDFASLPDTVS